MMLPLSCTTVQSLNSCPAILHSFHVRMGLDTRACSEIWDLLCMWQDLHKGTTGGPFRKDPFKLFMLPFPLLMPVYSPEVICIWWRVVCSWELFLIFNQMAMTRVWTVCLLSIQQEIKIKISCSWYSNLNFSWIFSRAITIDLISRLVWLSMSSEFTATYIVL